jgi:hypothetical protein
MKLLRYFLLSLLLFVLLVAFWQAKPSIQVSKVAGAAESFRAQEPAKALSAMPTTITEAQVIHRPAAAAWPGFDGIVRTGERSRLASAHQRSGG